MTLWIALLAHVNHYTVACYYCMHPPILRYTTLHTHTHTHHDIQQLHVEQNHNTQLLFLPTDPSFSQCCTMSLSLHACMCACVC